MKKTKFAYCLHKFFTVYLLNVKGCTPATVDSYRHAVILFLTFMEGRGISADKIEVTDLTRQNILEYLDWLQDERSNSVSTRNHRQAVINSFVKYLMYELPEYLIEFQEILSIPIKKAPRKEIVYLKTNAITLLFDQIDTTSKGGLRDYTVLTLMYTTGIRVSELINIKVRDISLLSPSTLLVHGKGQKSRFVPLPKQALAVLKRYLDSADLNNDADLSEWLFRNHMKKKFTRQGINYLLKKYVDKARSKDPQAIPLNFSPHCMRHTVAMELVDSGVDLIYIRDLFGHVSVSTTEVYIKVSSTKKREAIELASKMIVPEEEAQWKSDCKLKDWLSSFNR